MTKKNLKSVTVEMAQGEGKEVPWVSARQGHSLKERCWSAGDGRIRSLPASKKTLMKDFKLKIDECQKTLLGDTKNVSY